MSTRRGGILLHPTSLPNGVLDHEVFRWLDFLAEAGLTVWQTLPLGIPQAGDSPYQCDSAFAINPAFASGLEETPVDSETFLEWQKAQQFWLQDYALFATLKQHFDHKPWYLWPDEFRFRKAESLNNFAEKYANNLLKVKEEQFRLYSLWQKVRQHARERGIYLFGDMPIFIAQDSADVWSRPQDFLLDEQGQPTVVTGVPPDYFSETGQRWGNPHYNWDQHEASGFEWWLQRLEAHFECFDLVRIDHFRGLEAVWTIDSQCKTAVEGYWQTVPGEALLQKLSDRYQPLPLVAEDLGMITPEVTALRDKFHLPGMAVLQFSFDYFDDNPHKPQNIQANTVVYTGTHDNDTTQGWFSSLDLDEQQRILHIIGADNPEQANDTIINRALSTQANLAIVPLQDYLGLGTEARMNVPGLAQGNWRWRFESGQITSELAQQIHEKLDACGRLP